MSVANFSWARGQPWLVCDMCEIITLKVGQKQPILTRQLGKFQRKTDVFRLDQHDIYIFWRFLDNNLLKAKGFMTQAND